MASKSIIIFPIKAYSERVPRKNFHLVNGTPLYKILPARAQLSGVFDTVVIDSDSQEILDWAAHVGIVPLRRRPEHATDAANGNTLLRYHVNRFNDYDYYWQGFVTTPFVSIDTIKEMALALQCGKPLAHRAYTQCDSVMTVTEHRGFFWSADGRPLTYRPEVMPRTQDVQAIYKEVHGLFGVTAGGFRETRTRAGQSPYFYVLPANESVDVDWPADVANLLDQPSDGFPDNSDHLEIS